MIENNVFQTWKTQNLPNKIEKILIKNRELNPEHEFIIYTDEQTYDFVNSNFSGEIFDAFSKLKHPVARADFWRYLILYKYGGCYLDIDSKFNNSINDFVNNNDEALISAEKNPNNYVQWALFYKKEHPILMRTVELIISNINKGLFKNNIESLTGPKIYAESIKEYYKFSTNEELNWSSINRDTNSTFEFKKNNQIHKARLFSIDYKDNVKFKHKHSNLLYGNSDHWLKTQEISPLY